MVYDVRIKNKNKIVKCAVEAEFIFCLDFYFFCLSYFYRRQKKMIFMEREEVNEDKKRKDTV